MKDADANIPHMDVALMSLQPQLEKATLVVLVILISSAAVPMASQSPPDHTTKAVTARAASSNAAPTTSRQLKVPTSRDAHARPASTDAAQMEPAKLKERTLRDARIKFLTQHRKLAALRKKWERAATTTPSNTSSTPNMAVAVVSGTAAAAATRIASSRRTTAKKLAWSHLAKTFATSPKSMVHARAITPCGITIPTEILAHNSFTEDVLAMLIDSRKLKTVKLNVLLTTRFVSFFQSSLEHREKRFVVLELTIFFYSAM